MEQTNPTQAANSAQPRQLSDQEWAHLVDIAGRAARSKSWHTGVNADDLASDVLYKLAAVPALPEVFARYSKGPYVWTVARNALIDQVRGNGRRPTVSLDAGVSKELTSSMATDGGTVEFEQIEAARSIARLARRIPWPPAEREVMNRLIQGMTIEEIAESLGKPTTTVRGTLSRARARAREFRDIDALLREACPPPRDHSR